MSNLLMSPQDYTATGRAQIVELLRDRRATEATTYARAQPTGPA